MDYIIGQKRPDAPAAAGSKPEPIGRGAQPYPPGTDAGFGDAGPVPMDALIVDGDQRTFMQDVIEDSRHIPVLVDFWATWCGPCKTLTPLLEKVTRAAAGRIKLVKIDIDQNRSLVSQLSQLGLPLQSVPTVAAFWQGQILDLFQGALPESEIKRFVEALLKAAGGAMPSADTLAAAREALEAGRSEEAAGLFSQLVEQEPEGPEGWSGLARALLALGDEEQAAAVLDQAPAKIAEHPELAGARAALTLAAEGRAAAGALGGLHARLAADENDHEARYELATGLNGVGDRQAAADALLDILKRDRNWNEGAARLQLIKFFDAWGFDDPVTLAARRRMSALLFS
ncbi:tetratricopeptide repeat protein [Rhizosaccharibacter radicis]|uniref:Tetratricopeptide repeat protein n=1 Tax=Rhizosaccharibacter radicis TaxID=2782605 RepID=A0ABT1VZ75_9PROT|nr:tetratricopeptide repeat protein [Acetobacteraceae bacterium KSS12]